MTVHQKEGCTTNGVDNAETDAGELVWDARAGVRYPLTRAVALELELAYGHASFAILVAQPGGTVLGTVTVNEPVVLIVLGLRFSTGAHARSSPLPSPP